MGGHLIICWRCGVEFDPAPFIEHAPCPDCQLDVPGQWYNVFRRDVLAQMKYDIFIRLYEQRLSDKAIAAKLGVSTSMVRDFRLRHELPAVGEAGLTGENADKHLEYLRSEAHRRKIIEGQKKGKRHKKAGASSRRRNTGY